jgi:hypothetical protein
MIHGHPRSEWEPQQSMEQRKDIIHFLSQTPLGRKSLNDSCVTFSYFSQGFPGAAPAWQVLEPMHDLLPHFVFCVALGTTWTQTSCLLGKCFTTRTTLWSLCFLLFFFTIFYQAYINSTRGFSLWHCHTCVWWILNKFTPCFCLVLIFFFWLVGWFWAELAFELRALDLLGRCSTT